MRVLKMRNGNSDIWTEKNPVLMEGEPGYERDTSRFKIGNGFDHWNDLPYQAYTSDSGHTPADLQEHIISPTPHPIYDDGPSLFLLYQNAKV